MKICLLIAHLDGVSRYVFRRFINIRLKSTFFIKNKNTLININLDYSH